MLFVVVKEPPCIGLAFEMFWPKIPEHFVVVWGLLPIGRHESRRWFDQKSVIRRFRFSSRLGHFDLCFALSSTVDQHQLRIPLIIRAGCDTLGHLCRDSHKKTDFCLSHDLFGFHCKSMIQGGFSLEM